MTSTDKLNPTVEHIKRTILLYFINNGRQMIPTVAKAIGFSIPTVNKYISELIEEGDLINLGKSKTQRGRQPNYYDLNAESRYYIGVDVKYYGVSIGIMNLKGEIILCKEHYGLSIENTPTDLDYICELIKQTIDSSGIARSAIRRVGVNLSGRIDSKRGFSYSLFNFEGNDEPLSETLTETLGISTFIENDTRAMTYGELIAGAGQNFRDFLFINVSWGIGMGIVIDGKLHYGSNGFSGEIGHINAYNNELMCHCGKKGCLETEVSGRAIQRQFLKRLQDGEVSSLSRRINNGEHIDITDIIRAAREDDTLSIELIESMGTELGRQLANLINIFNPEAVIIGGALAGAGDNLLSPISQAIRKYALRLASRSVQISFSTLREKVGITGACMLARQRDIDAGI